MRTINIDGPDGNAFALLGMAKIWSKQLGLDHKIICDKMTSGDYEHLCEVFEDHFGDYVELERD
jgi:hypothetical protein